jgi:peptidoglycan/xylan/chitin deacetylase (PgdA/CDA1 family)
MDGTADAVLMMAMFSDRHSPSKSTATNFTYDHGAITRGDKTVKKLALVFTGDEFGEGADDIAKTLEKEKVKASFFLTGRFYRNPAFSAAIKRLKRDGNYLGPHSNEHLLYADWTDRNKTLVTKEQFDQDLAKNYEAMQRFGINKSATHYFLPPYEWHNETIAEWTSANGSQLVNFTPGTGSNADYTTPSMKNYVSSDAILQRIKAYQAKDPNGLNGFILLMHIGAGPERTDKLYSRLPELIEWLRSKNYEIVRIDQLFSK